MFKLFRFLKEYKIYAFLGPFLKFAEALMETFVPFIMSQIIDIGIKNSDKAYILKMGGVLVLFAVLGWIFAISAQFFCAKAAMGFGFNIRNALFEKILKMDMKTIDKFSIPSLITRTTTDVKRTETGLNMFLRLILRLPFVLLGAIVMSAVINKTIALIYLVILPLIIVVVFISVKFSLPYHRKVQKLIDKISTFCRENIIGVRSVRAFRLQKKEMDDFAEKADVTLQNQIKADKISMLNTPLLTLIINCAIVVVLYLGSKFVNRGLLLSGSIIALVNYLIQILTSIERFATLIDSFNKANASADRILEVFNEKDSIVKEEKAFVKKSNIAISVKDLSFSYNGGENPALKNINFELKEGESLGIIGGTGAGKSTLIKLLRGMYEPTSGTIEIFGNDIKKLGSEINSLYSVAEQKAILFKGTIKENLVLGSPDATDEEINDAVVNSCCNEFVEKKEGGLNYQIEYGGSNVSGGQKQRLTIARSLLKKCEFLVLDDATSALDYYTESKIRKFLVSNALSDRTKIIVSQRISAVSLCDKILVLEDGLVNGFGTKEELMKTSPVFREIFLAQTGDLEEVPVL